MSVTKKTAEEQPATTATPAAIHNTNHADGPMLELVLTQTIALAMHNAVSAQQNAQVLNAAIVSATCNRILSVKDAANAQQNAITTVTVKNDHAATGTRVQPATAGRKKAAAKAATKK